MSAGAEAVAGNYEEDVSEFGTWTGSEKTTESTALKRAENAPGTGSADRKVGTDHDYADIAALIERREFEEARRLISLFDWKEDDHLALLGLLFSASGREEEGTAHLREALRINPLNERAYSTLERYFEGQWVWTWARARRLTYSGRASKGLKLLRSLMVSGHENADVLRDAGEACYALGDEKESERLLRLSFAQRRDAWTALMLARLYVSAHRWEEGSRMMDAALALNGSLSGEMRRIRCLCNAGKGQNCAQELREMMASGYEHDAIAAAEQIAGMAECNPELLLDSLDILEREKRRPELAAKRAMALARLGRIGDAENVIAAHWKGMEARIQRMHAFRLSGLLEDAERTADELLKSGAYESEVLYTKLICQAGRKEEWDMQLLKKAAETEDVQLLSLCLEIYKTRHMDREVIHVCQKLRKLGQREAAEDLAIALERTGRVRKAVSVLEREMRAHPSLKILSVLSAMYARHGMRDEERLIDQASRIMDLPPELLERAAKLKMQRSDFDGAIKLVQTALSKGETPEGHFLAANIHFEAGNVEGAEKSLRRAVETGYPQMHTEVLFGKIMERRGDNQGALQRYTHAIALGNSSAELLLSRAKVLSALGREEDAIEDVNKAAVNADTQTLLECMRLYSAWKCDQQCAEIAEQLILKDRKNPEAWKLRGFSLLHLKRYDEAISSFEAALAIRKEEECLRGLKEAYQAKKETGKVVRTIDMMLQSGTGDAKLMMEKADILFSEKNYDEAAAVYEQCIRKGEQRAILGKAKCLQILGNFQEEVRLLSSVDEKDAEALLLLSKAYSALQRYSDAIDALDSAMSLRQDDARLPAAKAKLLIEINRAEEAERYADIALQLNPRESDALEAKATALMLEGDHERALEIFNAALAAGLCNASIYQGRGDCLRKLERFAEACDSYSRAIREGSQEAQLGKGMCELALGKASAATITLSDYTRKKGRDHLGWCYLGEALLKQGIYGEASRALKKSLDMKETARAWKLLGKAEVEQGELESAEKSLQKAAEMSPEDHEVIELLEECRRRMRDIMSEENAKKLLRLEAQTNKIPTREEAFSVCNIPMEDIDAAMELIRSPSSLPVPEPGEKGWVEMETKSARVLQKCLENEETELLGLRLCDIVRNFPSMPLDEAKQLFEYISSVGKMDTVDYIEDPSFQRMLKRAMKLKGRQRSLTGIIRNLGTGIYWAKVIEGTLASMGKSGYAPTYVRLSSGQPEQPKESLYERFYEEKQEQTHDERCLYHGAEAVGYCSHCHTMLCGECISATAGKCPNCDSILMAES